MGFQWGWHDIMWRRFPAPGWPFPDKPRRARLSPFTCLLMILLVPILLLVVPQIWNFLNPTSAVGSLSVGDCFSGWATSAADLRTQQTRVRVVDCAAPHESELIDRVEHLEGPHSAAQMCSTSFTGYVGLTTARSSLLLSFAGPSRADLEQGDPELLCIVSFPSGEEVGSVRGANR